MTKYKISENNKKRGYNRNKHHNIYNKNEPFRKDMLA